MRAMQRATGGGRGRQLLARFWRDLYSMRLVVWGVLREVFDETAYERFLARRGCQSSPEAYAEFQGECAGIQSRRPRCC